MADERVGCGRWERIGRGGGAMGFWVCAVDAEDAGAEVCEEETCEGCWGVLVWGKRGGGGECQGSIPGASPAISTTRRLVSGGSVVIVNGEASSL